MLGRGMTIGLVKDYHYLCTNTWCLRRMDTVPLWSRVSQKKQTCYRARVQMETASKKIEVFCLEEVW